MNEEIGHELNRVESNLIRLEKKIDFMMYNMFFGMAITAAVGQSTREAMRLTREAERMKKQIEDEGFIKI